MRKLESSKKVGWIKTMNSLGKKKIPFLFILDFELHNPIVFPLDKLPKNIYYKVNNIKNYSLSGILAKPLIFKKKPVQSDTYIKAFDQILKEINYGNSFLINLTFPTEISTNYTLRELFNVSQAKYKLYFDDRFIVSSPEPFVKITNEKIYTFPMKGTIDASIPNAMEIIQNDAKEMAEHYTIVDLLRNDLSKVSKNVKVNRFRFIERLQTNNKNLFQVSSEIEGQLSSDFHSHIGNIFESILPAGSISGAPKKKTVEIIKTVELDNRGYYTGVFGIFDGRNLDSAVMIRYIEQCKNKLIYRSGCGITNMSDCMTEYNEMIDKIYVPINRKY